MKHPIYQSSVYIQLAGLVILLSLNACSNPSTSDQKADTNTVDIQFPYPADHYEEALDGRLILLISDESEAEPRFQLRDDSKTCQGFGMDVEDWMPGENQSFDGSSFGGSQVHDPPHSLHSGSRDVAGYPIN